MALENVGDIQYEAHAHKVDFGVEWIVTLCDDLESAQVVARQSLDENPTIDYVLIVKAEVTEKVER